MILLTLLASAAFVCTNPRAIDGDTIKCGTKRVRLLGIDAPELPGDCRRGRVCVDGDPFVSKNSLARRLLAGPGLVRPVTTDRYGRTVAMVLVAGSSLSCWQLQAGRAVYVARWDNGGRVRRECGR